MSKSRMLSMVLILLAGLIGYAAHRPAPQPLAFPPGSTSVTRGSQLVTLGSCDDCHTPQNPDGSPDMSRRFSGHPAGSALPPAVPNVLTSLNLAWRGPWGLSLTRNITPGKAGISGWTLEQFIHTMRTGVDPSGHTLLPPMPVENYARLPDSDLTAIYNFIQTVPPSDNQVTGP